MVGWRLQLLLWVALCGAALATPASAQRVFVGAQGSDANPCSFALPCRTFQHAHDTAAAGGEIDVLDPAGYGILTIRKSISIQGHGFAGISTPLAQVGITVAAGASDVVHLNGLLIDGAGRGLNGIQLQSVGSLVVENCVIRNAGANGVVVDSNATTPQAITVSNSYIADNANSGLTIGSRSTGAVAATIERTVFAGNGFAGLGVFSDGGTGPIDASVTDSIASNNANGVSIQSSAVQSVVRVTLTHVAATGNRFGVAANDANATLRITRCTVTGNTTGFAVNGAGVIVSYGDNLIDDNGGNRGGLTPASKR